MCQKWLWNATCKHWNVGTCLHVLLVLLSLGFRDPSSGSDFKYIISPLTLPISLVYYFSIHHAFPMLLLLLTLLKWCLYRSLNSIFYVVIRSLAKQSTFFGLPLSRCDMELPKRKLKCSCFIPKVMMVCPLGALKPVWLRTDTSWYCYSACCFGWKHPLNNKIENHYDLLGS